MNQWSFITQAGQALISDLQRITTGPTKVFAFINQKGGVGKTTVGMNVATSFAAQGFATLFIEADPSTRAGYYVAGRGKRGVLDLPLNTTSYMLYTSEAARYGIEANVWGVDVPWLLNHIPAERMGEMPDIIVRRGWTRAQVLHVLPGHERIAELDNLERLRAVNADMSPFVPQAVFTRSLNTAKAHYDVVVIDTGPATNPTRSSSMAAATYFIIVDGLDMNSINDINATMKTGREIIADAPHLHLVPPEFLGHMANRYTATDQMNDVPLLEAYTRKHRDPDTGQWEEPWVDLPFLGAIRADPDPSPYIKSAMNRRRPLILNDPVCYIAEDFHQLTLNVQRASGLPLPVGER
jgi:cellulose biosynthesis protein BcsQ